MSRYFALQTWVGSHDNEPDYNGNQCGSRNVRSMPVIPLYDRFGNANVSAFSDAAIEARKAKPKKKASDSIDLANKHLERMEKLGEDLDQEYLNGEIDKERYDYLRYKMDLRLVKAWERVERENREFWNKEDESLSFDLSDVSYLRSGTRLDQENASSSVFDLFKAGTQAIPEAVCKGSAKEIENSFWTEAKYFLTASIAGAMILISLANL